MSPYFELRYSIEPKVVGVRHGLGQANLGAAFFANNPWYNELFGPEHARPDRWKQWATLRNYAQPLRNVPFDKAARRNDFIHAGTSHGYIVSERVRALLEAYVLPPHAYLEVTFQRGAEVFGGYWWLLYDLEQGVKTVDFAQSEFDLTWHQRTYSQPFRIQTYQEYLALIEQTGRAAAATKLVFTPAFDQGLDLWGTQFLSQRSYCSSRLLQAFQAQHLTGYQERVPRCPLLFTSDKR